MAVEEILFLEASGVHDIIQRPYYETNPGNKQPYISPRNRGTVLIEGDGATEGAREPEFRTELVRGRLATQAISRRNQLLLNHWSFPSQADLMVLGSAIQQKPEDHRYFPTSSSVVKMGSLLIVLTGRTLADIFFVAGSPSSIEPGTAYIDVTNGCWYSAPPSVPNAAIPKEDEQEYYLTTEAFLKLPLHPKACTLLQEIQSHFKNESEKKEIQSKIQKWLNKLNEEAGTRLSIAMLSHTLLSRTLQHNTDHVVSALLTADPILSRHNGLYYLCVSRSQLGELYANSVNRLIEELNLQDYGLLEPLQQPGHIGSRITPTDQTVINQFSKIGKSISLLSHRVRSLKEVINFHNQYTSYVVLALYCATGCRPIKNAVARWTDIDLRLNQLLISDKDEYGNSSTRIIGLSPSISLQLQLYRDHRASLLRRIKSHHQEVVELWDLEHIPLFFIDPVLYCQRPISPESMSSYLDKDKPLAANAFRHWFRSVMARINCPGELVDMAMGHWRLGQNPYDPQSSMHRLRSTQVQASHIEVALEAISFTPIKGFSG